jgi:hypothetical protein
MALLSTRSAEFFVASFGMTHSGDFVCCICRKKLKSFEVIAFGILAFILSGEILFAHLLYSTLVKGTDIDDALIRTSSPRI